MSQKYTKEELADLPFMDMSLDIEERINDLIGRMTLEEMFKLSSGKWIFFTKPLKRLGIKKFKMSDGPHGVGSGIFFLKKMTYFPTAIGRTATWNPELSEQFGKAIGEEIRSVGRNMLLAPGINIDRTPLGGRTFEYQTEDPYLNKVTAVAMVKGVQGQRVAACVKHYAANNQEYNRFKVSTEVSQRALEEIYYPAFKATVEEADAWSMMACYNRLNGILGCEHVDLVRETLMNKWGFRGFVVSDWFATRYTKTAPCVKAGLTLEMPVAIVYKVKKLKEALEAGEFTEEIFKDNFKRLLRVMFLTGFFDEESSIPQGSRNTPEHHAVVRQIAEEGIVLLKNENNALPLDINKLPKIAVIGPMAKRKTGFGGGSSMVRPKYEITPLKGIKAKCKKKFKFVSKPEKADVVVLVVGIAHKKFQDRENKDKYFLELPSCQIDLINETVEKNPKTIVVVVNGSPVSMEGWIDKVPAVVEAWFGGNEAGNAIANVLFGDVNPSGKLPVTFPKKLIDSSAHSSWRTYPGIRTWENLKEGDIKIKHSEIRITWDHKDKVYYDEGVFVGYRHFDAKEIEPLFPFGHGLSYTTFKYSNLKLSKNQISGVENFTLSVDISNTGSRTGAEVVQLYVQDVECSVERPPKELKGFSKINLEPGEKKTVTIALDKSALSFYDEKAGTWKAEKGKFNILVGSSSRDIRIQGELDYLG